MAKANAFARFDVVSDDSDHQFLGSEDGKCFSDTKSEVYSTIMREWRILEKNLPDSIYVRVYERRIDLMRAVIVGAAGTPYHDGLFFFDIVFPSDYPKNPPKLHYRSFGLRLNPNLYPDGKVCLSLLNTWHGKKKEKWDPSGSTMLQVLLSIQGLVLTEKPFYNEPGTDTIGRFVFDFESKSRLYTQNAYATTCNTSYSLIRKPPRNFEAFVRVHFRERAFAIVDACAQYVNGRLSIGYYSCDTPSPPLTVQVTREFKEWMIYFYPRFVHVLRWNGAPLGSMAHHLDLEWDQSENENSAQREQSQSKGAGIFKEVVEKIKQVFRWKKNENKKTSSLASASK